MGKYNLGPKHVIKPFDGQTQSPEMSYKTYNTQI